LLSRKRVILRSLTIPTHTISTWRICRAWVQFQGIALTQKEPGPHCAISSPGYCYHIAIFRHCPLGVLWNSLKTDPSN
jgi:hypothetical protein